jgi:hypothetical protein
MGVDLRGPGIPEDARDHYNWGAWRLLFDVGVRFGWRPAGAIPADLREVEDGYVEIVDEPDGERVGYFSNDYQEVTDEDVRAWASALGRAVKANDGLGPRNAHLALTPDEIECIHDFIAVAKHGGFRIF